LERGNGEEKSMGDETGRAAKGGRDRRGRRPAGNGTGGSTGRERLELRLRRKESAGKKQVGTRREPGTQSAGKGRRPGREEQGPRAATSATGERGRVLARPLQRCVPRGERVEELVGHLGRRQLRSGHADHDTGGPGGNREASALASSQRLRW
jgi:hypothetical protein